MKNSISFLSALILICIIFDLKAQVAGYSFSQYTGNYSEITGDTIVAYSTSTITNPYDLDDVTYPSNRIPFNFIFNGVSYTSFAINTNGFITFGSTPPVSANYGPIAATEVYSGAVSGFGINLIGIFGTNADRIAGNSVLSNVTSFAGVVAGRLITGTGIAVSATIVSFNTGAGTITMSAGATSSGNNETIQIAAASIVRSTQGSPGNRVHIIQFKNFRRNTTTGTVDNLNFQIKLYELTGKVEVVYGNIFEGPIPVFGQVGLRGILHSDFNNRTTSSVWTSTIAGLTNDVQCMISSSIFPHSGLTFVWGPPPAVLSLKVIQQGFYNTAILNLNKSDTVTVFLKNSTFPFGTADSAKAVIDSVTFSGVFIFNNSLSGSYYIVTRHRNCIETWSKLGGESISSGLTVNYDFTDQITKSYGSNMSQINTSPLRFGMYSGDINQDGTIDASDLSEVENGATASLSGYLPADLNGDDFIDAGDVSIVENNIGVNAVTP